MEKSLLGSAKIPLQLAFLFFFCFCFLFFRRFQGNVAHSIADNSEYCVNIVMGVDCWVLLALFWLPHKALSALFCKDQ